LGVTVNDGAIQDNSGVDSGCRCSGWSRWWWSELVTKFGGQRLKRGS